MLGCPGLGQAVPPPPRTTAVCAVRGIPTVFVPYSAAQMGVEEKEAEFWRIVEEGGCLPAWRACLPARPPASPPAGWTACLPACPPALPCVLVALEDPASQAPDPTAFTWRLLSPPFLPSPPLLSTTTTTTTTTYHHPPGEDVVEALYGNDLDSCECGSGFPRGPPLGTRCGGWGGVLPRLASPSLAWPNL